MRKLFGLPANRLCGQFVVASTYHYNRICHSELLYGAGTPLTRQETATCVIPTRTEHSGV